MFGGHWVVLPQFGAHTDARPHQTRLAPQSVATRRSEPSRGGCHADSGMTGHLSGALPSLVYLDGWHGDGALRTTPANAASRFPSSY